MYKKHSFHSECVERRMCSGDLSLSYMSVTFAFTLVACSVTTNNSPYIKKWGSIQSSTPPGQKDINV